MRDTLTLPVKLKEVRKKKEFIPVRNAEELRQYIATEEKKIEEKEEKMKEVKEKELTKILKAEEKRIESEKLKEAKEKQKIDKEKQKQLKKFDKLQEAERKKSEKETKKNKGIANPAEKSETRISLEEKLSQGQETFNKEIASFVENFPLGKDIFGEEAHVVLDGIGQRLNNKPKPAIRKGTRKRQAPVKFEIKDSKEKQKCNKEKEKQLKNRGMTSDIFGEEPIEAHFELDEIEKKSELSEKPKPATRKGTRKRQTLKNPQVTNKRTKMNIKQDRKNEETIEIVEIKEVLSVKELPLTRIKETVMTEGYKTQTAIIEKATEKLEEEHRIYVEKMTAIPLMNCKYYTEELLLEKLKLFENKVRKDLEKYKSVRLFKVRFPENFLPKRLL